MRRNQVPGYVPDLPERSPPCRPANPT